MRVDIRARCAHGLPVDAYCAACVPVRATPPRESRLSDDVAAVAPKLTLEPLHLPPLGDHEPRVDRARGVWTVTCACGGFRARGGEPARHHIEQAWGAHRNDREAS